jgi:hypothetical protein
MKVGAFFMPFFSQVLAAGVKERQYQLSYDSKGESIWHTH